MSKNPFIKGTFIMGVVNTTPDSFSDGGQFYNADRAVAHAHHLLDAGADIIDVGGESTRPGAQAVSVDEELSRVIPVIEKLNGVTPWISIDTRNAVVMREAIRAGATMVNDVSALEDDSESLPLMAQYNVPICLMHKKGQPDSMQNNPLYHDVVKDVFDYLHSRIQTCVDQGIAKDRLIIDPGIGFGKTVAHNLALLNQIGCFHDLEVPIMMGTSRKSFIEKVMQKPVSVQDRLGGSIATILWGVRQNVQIFRVHDVFETNQAITIYKEISNG